MYKKLPFLIIIVPLCFLATKAIAYRPVLPQPAVIKDPNLYLEIAKEKSPKLKEVLEKWKLIDLYAISNSIKSVPIKIVETSDDVTLKLVLTGKGSFKNYLFYSNIHIESNEEVKTDIEINDLENLVTKVEGFELTKKFLKIYPEANAEISSYLPRLKVSENDLYGIRYGANTYNIRDSIYKNRCYENSCLAVSPRSEEIPAFTLQVPLKCSLIFDLPSIIPEFENVLKDDSFKILQDNLAPNLFGVIYSGKDVQEQQTKISIVFPFLWGEQQDIIINYHFQNSKLVNKDIGRDRNPADASKLLEKIKNGILTYNPKYHGYYRKEKP